MKQQFTTKPDGDINSNPSNLFHKRKIKIIEEIRYPGPLEQENATAENKDLPHRSRAIPVQVWLENKGTINAGDILCALQIDGKAQNDRVRLPLQSSKTKGEQSDICHDDLNLIGLVTSGKVAHAPKKSSALGFINSSYYFGTDDRQEEKQWRKYSSRKKMWILSHKSGILYPVLVHIDDPDSISMKC